MNSISIKYAKTAQNPDLHQVIIEGVNDLAMYGFQTEIGLKLPVSETDGVIYAVEPEDNDIVGVLCFRRDQHTRTITVTLAYVEPSSRRQGVFTDMYLEMQKRALDEGYLTIYIDVHAANEAARAAVSVLRARPKTIKFAASVS